LMSRVLIVISGDVIAENPADGISTHGGNASE